MPDQGSQITGDPALLALLARRTTNAVIVTDASGRTEWVNEGFTRITGYQPADIMGRSPGSLLQGPDTDPAAVAQMAAHLARAEPFNLEVLNYAADGRSYWIEIDCEPIVDDGVITHFIAIQTDVTHRKVLEHNLLRAERVAKMGHWTLEVATGAVTWSDETYRIFGLPEGTPIPPVDAVIALYHPDDQAAVREIIHAATQAGDGFSFRKRLGPDPTRWVDVRAECERGVDGTAVRFFGTIQDVTELVEAMAIQHAQEDRFRALADTLPGVAFQWTRWRDGSARFTYMSPNAEDVLGMPTDRLMADWRTFAVDLRDREAFDRSIEKAVADRTDWSFSGRRLHPVQGEQWFTANAKLLDDGSGTLVYNGIVIDDTKARSQERILAKARDEAEAANRAKSAFLATMSHELRTPLNAVIGYSEILASELYGPHADPRYRSYANDILSSGQYLHDLIEGVLDLSSIEAGKVELSVAVNDAAEIARAVDRLVRPRAEQANIELEIDVPADTLVRCDARGLKQILINCLDNGIKYTPEGGRVSLTVDREGAYWRFRVADNGPGIPDADLPRLTEAFYRGANAGSALQPRSHGAGIGLSIVDRYVQAMSGTLRVETAEGHGTTLHILLVAEDGTLLGGCTTNVEA